MPSMVKELMVEELVSRFKNLAHTGCIVVGYQGMNAEGAVATRQAVREFGADMMVVKNNLFDITLRRLDLEQISSLVDGPTAIIWGEDPVSAAKGSREAAKACEALQVRGAYAEGRVFDAAGVEKLADIPGRETLLSQALTCLRRPAQLFVSLLQVKMREFVSVLAELRKKKEAGSE